MAQVTRLSPVGLPMRPYKVGAFSGKQLEANPHPVFKVTRRGPLGLPMRHYKTGAFLNKTEAPITIQFSSFVLPLVFGTPRVSQSDFIRLVGIPSPETLPHDVTLTIGQGAVDSNPVWTNYKVSLTGGPDPRSAIVPLTDISHMFAAVAPGSYTATWQLSNADGSVVDTVDLFTRTISVGIFGTPTITLGVKLSGFTVPVTFGNPTVTAIGAAQSIRFDGANNPGAVGIPSTLVMGTPKITQHVSGLGGFVIPVLFGTPLVISGQRVNFDGFGPLLPILFGTPTVNAAGVVHEGFIFRALVRPKAFDAPNRQKAFPALGRPLTFVVPSDTPNRRKLFTVVRRHE